MFHHDCPLVVKSASTPWHLVHKKTWRDSLPIDMLPSGTTIPATVPQRSEIPAGLMNYPAFLKMLFISQSYLFVFKVQNNDSVYIW
jgi:hypothetical protein